MINAVHDAQTKEPEAAEVYLKKKELNNLIPIFPGTNESNNLL